MPRDQRKRRHSTPPAAGVVHGDQWVVQGDVTPGASPAGTGGNDPNAPKGWANKHRYRIAAAAAVFGAMAIAVSLLTGDKPVRPPVAAPSAVTGGCSPFTVWAQNEWAPYGVKVMSDITVNRTIVRHVAANDILEAGGWRAGHNPHPGNPGEFGRPIWFRLANRSGWVHIAGVRTRTTVPEDAVPVESQVGHFAVPTTPECEIK